MAKGCGGGGDGRKAMPRRLRTGTAMAAPRVRGRGLGGVGGDAKVRHGGSCRAGLVGRDWEKEIERLSAGDQRVSHHSGYGA